MSRFRREMVGRGSECTGSRSPLAWGAAILLLGVMVAGVIGAAIVLWQNINVEALFSRDRGTPAEIDRPRPPYRPPPLPATRSWTAHRYHSDSSERLYPDATYPERLEAHWDRLLVDAGGRVRPVSDLAELEDTTRTLWVIPAAVCLAAREREAIRRHLERGGSLLASGAIGARDAECEWIGYEFVLELTAGALARTVENRSAAYLTIPSESALGAGLAAGTRIELGTEDWVAVQVPPPYVFWSDWALNPAPVPGDGRADAAVVTRRTSAGGRVVWTGFRVDAGASEYDQKRLDRLAQNAALWADGHILADLSPWPEGRRSALVVTQDVEHRFDNSRRLARRLLDRNVPVTFFVVTQLAERHPELGTLLRGAGEIGVHGVDHRALAGQPAASQRAALRKARDDIVGWAGVEPIGLRPPRELYDSVTLQVWSDEGGRYVAATDGARSVVPEIHEMPSGPIVLLPRVVDDDYSVMILRGRFSADSLRSGLMGGLFKMRSLGGLDLVTLHTQLIDSEATLAAVEAVVDTALALGDVWIARASEIADWWLRRGSLELELRERSDGGVRVIVRNVGSRAVSSVSLRLFLPGEGEAYAAPEVGDGGILSARFEPWGMRIDLPAVGPDETMEVHVPRREFWRSIGRPAEGSDSS